ncbi:MAG TPA: response regulator [Ktedonosporobacter sp.]|nr:response regulator [Ktedonosporobacter sp.]
MADVWRILVVEGEENLNQNIVNSLRIDGYIVQGIGNGADAVRALWSEEYDVVICDLKAPGVGGFELLQWLRTYRPNTRLIMVGRSNSHLNRVQALEGGAVAYLEKPLDMGQLKEELRRLLQQTGFSADLDSFDLLDVIQMITMSRNNIALLVNAGLEERGMLRFQNGELIWAEYGTLRGEEAFFALAAHKNGSVRQQPWSEPVIPNVKLPLSRLIFQALQYRTKYANVQPDVAAADPLANLLIGEEDDTPFIVEGPSSPLQSSPVPVALNQPLAPNQRSSAGTASGEWWEQTNKRPIQQHGVENNFVLPLAGDVAATSRFSIDDLRHTNGVGAPLSPPPVSPPAGDVNLELPSWLTEQPTASELPVIRPSAYAHPRQVPSTPMQKPSSPEWQSSSLPAAKTTEPIGPNQPSGPLNTLSANTEIYRTTSTDWQVTGQTGQQRTAAGRVSVPEQRSHEARVMQDNGSLSGLHPAIKPGYDYTALISALQTLGYSIKGFIAAAVVTLDGQLMAQVAIDDLDISAICKHFSTMMQAALLLFDEGRWGPPAETVVSSVDRSILLRLVGNEKKVLHVVITKRGASSADSLEIMANVEGALNAALQ